MAFLRQPSVAKSVSNHHQLLRAILQSRLQLWTTLKFSPKQTTNLIQRRSTSSTANWHDGFYRNYSQTLVSTEPIGYRNKPVVEFDHTPIAYRSLITSEEIVHRQHNLILLIAEFLEKISPSSCTKQSPLILIASSPAQFQANTNIPVNDCKASSDFIYFTGLHSGSSDQLISDCVLALFAEDSQKSDSPFRSVIFAPVRSKSDTLWNGADLPTHYRQWLPQVCDQVRPLSELVEFVNTTINPTRRDVFLSRNGLEYRPELVTHLKYFMTYSRVNVPPNDGDDKWSTTLDKPIKSATVRDASNLIDQLRLIKSDTECLALKRIGSIGAQALRNTIKWSQDIVFEQDESFRFYESHIGAKFDFESRLSGAKRLSFPSVCASGPRSTVIHYGRNDQPIDFKQNDSWILTDVGCEDVDGYCCDISRTWPIDNRNTDRGNFQLRLQLYEALISVQSALLQSIQIGTTSLNDLHRNMLTLLNQLLITFNVFDNSVATSDTMAITKKLCPHHASHYIGNPQFFSNSQIVTIV